MASAKKQACRKKEYQKVSFDRKLSIVDEINGQLHIPGWLNRDEQQNIFFTFSIFIRLWCRVVFQTSAERKALTLAKS